MYTVPVFLPGPSPVYHLCILCYHPFSTVFAEGFIECFTMNVVIDIISVAAENKNVQTVQRETQIRFKCNLNRKRNLELLLYHCKDP